MKFLWRWQTRMARMTTWWRQSDKNSFIQELCAILIGLGLGLYGYESKVALIPMKWHLDNKVANSIEKESRERQPDTLPKTAQIFRDMPNVVKDFWKKSKADRYLEHVHQYTQVMENLGIRGDLQKKVDELLRKGAEPIPEKWTRQENRPFVILGLLIIIAASVTKTLLYMHLLSFNGTSSKLLAKPQSRAMKNRPARAIRPPTDWNGIVQDACTITLGAIGGLYIQPSIEEFLKGEAPSYPYPMSGVLIFVGLLLVKMALSSSLLDIVSWRTGVGPLVSLRRFRYFSRAYNWNDLAHETCTLILGIGIGFYAYSSNLALLPLKWQTDRQVAGQIVVEATPREEQPSGFNPFGNLFGQNPVIKEQLNRFWDKTGVDRYAQNLEKYTNVYEHMGIRGRFKHKMDQFMRQGVEPIPAAWTAPANRPYLIAGLVILLICFILKIGLYGHILDINAIIKNIRATRQPVEWNEMLQEVTSITLSVMAGVYTDPTMAWLTGEEAISYPYPRLGPALLLGCVLAKFLIYCGILNLNRQVKAKARPAMKTAKPSGDCHERIRRDRD